MTGQHLPLSLVMTCFTLLVVDLDETWVEVSRSHCLRFRLPGPFCRVNSLAQPWSFGEEHTV